MYRYVLAIDDGCEGQLVEEFHEMVVHLLIIPLHTLFSEVKLGRDRPRLVVSSQEENVMRSFTLECTKIGHDFRPIHPTVNVVTKKEQLFDVACRSLDLVQHVKHIVELGVDIANNGYSAIDS